jgi:hypothetical protein
MNTFFKLAFNPFERVAGYTALVSGLIIAFVSSATGFIFNTRFDGVLDIHFADTTFLTALTEQLINIVSLCVIFSGIAFIVKGKSFRIIDVCGTLILARFPLLLTPFLNAGGFFLTLQPSETGKNVTLSRIEPAGIIFLTLASLILILIIIWHIILLYKAYRISTNIKGWKATASFILSLLLAEIMSKYLLFLWLK